MTGRFAFNVVGEGENQFFDVAGRESVFQALKIKGFRTDTPDGGKSPVKDMKKPAKRSRAFNCHEIRNLFYRTDSRAFPPFVGTNRTVFSALGNVPATNTAGNAFGCASQRFEKSGKRLRVFDEKMQCHAFRRTIADARKFF